MNDQHVPVFYAKVLNYPVNGNAASVHIGLGLDKNDFPALYRTPSIKRIEFLSVNRDRIFRRQGVSYKETHIVSGSTIFVAGITQPCDNM
jgi:hypothetical protein